MKQDLTPYNQIQDLWAQGIHVSSNGTEWNIADMPQSYLQNVINKFGGMGYDTSALEAQLSTDEGNLASSDTPTDVAPVSQASQ